MWELLVIVLIAVTFTRAGTNQSRGRYWGLIGVVYYLIGRVLFFVLLYGGYRIFSNDEIGSSNKMSFEVYRGLRIAELFGGMFFSVAVAFVLGEMSGLNLKRVFQK